MIQRIRKDYIYLGIAVGAFVVTAVGAGSWGIHHTSGSPFCTLCHEMKVVGEYGWMHSVHVQNPRGVVAECGDCHIPPELVHMLWVKARDGSKDVFVHFLGESDPRQMDWSELRETARGKIYDSSCLRCHANLTPKGAAIKTIIAHRAYMRLDGQKKCLDCHREEFHGGYRDYLNLDIVKADGGD